MHSLPTLGVLVLVGSAIPFVPTGELVSGSAALTGTGWVALGAVFLVSWLGSLLGDTVLLLEARLGRGRIQGWLEGRPLGQKVLSARATIDQNAFRAIVTGRLIPGGRAPVILGLGLSDLPLRRFITADAVACAVWAALYTGLGAFGGSITGDPVWGLVLAVTAAVSVSVLIPRVQGLVQTWVVQTFGRPASDPDSGFAAGTTSSASAPMIPTASRALSTPT
ncbi:MAG TPA: VTT domain-containing protein [Propionibacteriaceae bacterium]|nr:VTT domain-containing protein [Propionibacteriaceae bacterium]